MRISPYPRPCLAILLQSGILKGWVSGRCYRMRQLQYAACGLSQDPVCILSRVPPVPHTPCSYMFPHDNPVPLEGCDRSCLEGSTIRKRMFIGALAEKPRNGKCGKPFTTRVGHLSLERRILSSTYSRLASYSQQSPLSFIVCSSRADDAFGWRCLCSAPSTSKMWCARAFFDLQHPLAQSEGAPSNHCVQSGKWMPTAPYLYDTKQLSTQHVHQEGHPIIP